MITFVVLATLLLAALGVLAGLATGALGVGATVLFVPALLWGLPELAVPLGATPAVAIATSLAASCVLTACSARAHWQAGNLPLASGRSVGGALTAAAAGGLLGGVFIVSTSAAWVGLSLAAAQFVIAVVLVWRSRTSASCSSVVCAPASPATLSDKRTLSYCALVGGLTSIGAGGVFLVPYFLWRGVQRAQAVAIASLIGMAIAAAATVVFAAHQPSLAINGTLGFVHVPIAIALALGAYFGTRVGARLVKRTNGPLWTRLLAGALLVSSARAVAKVVI